MGVDRTGESALLELLASEDVQLGVKNTFLHYDCDEEGGTLRSAGLLRHRTAPAGHPGAEGPGQKAERRLSQEGPRGGVPAESPAAERQRGVWAVEARKLRGRDTRLAKTFAMSVGAVAASDAQQLSTTDFVVMLVPRAVNKRRGGASFGASRGRGYVQVKCNDPPDVELDLTLTVGDLPSVTIQHNFELQGSVCVLPGDYDFEEAVENLSDTFQVVFEAKPLGLPLTQRTPSPSLAVEEEAAPFHEVSDPAQPGSPWSGTDAAQEAQWCFVPGSGEQQDWSQAPQDWNQGSVTWWAPVYAPAETQAQAWPSSWDASPQGAYTVWYANEQPVEEFQ